MNQVPHRLDLWQWICGVPKSVFAKCAYGFKRDIAVEDEVKCDGRLRRRRHRHAHHLHARLGRDRPARNTLRRRQGRRRRVPAGDRQPTGEARAGDQRFNGPRRSRRLFTDQLDQGKYVSTETRGYESVWGAQHAEVQRNFAAAVRGEEQLLAPGSEGSHGVRLANAIHLSSWLGQEVSIEDFDEDRYLAELNRQVKAEGKFPPSLSASKGDHHGGARRAVDDAEGAHQDRRDVSRPQAGQVTRPGCGRSLPKSP